MMISAHATGVALLTAFVAPSAGAAQRHVTAVPCAPSALAAAIAAANGTVLRLAPFCTYLLTAALPQVTGHVVLLGGPSTSIKRDPATPDLRLLDVAAGGGLRVEGIGLLNGATTTGPGGGVRNAGTLVLDHVTLTGNSALNNNGGGVENTGTALITHSILTANVTQGPSGNRDGGGIHNDGTLTVVASRLNGDIAVRDGGAVFTTAGHTTHVVQSTISGNTAAHLGGGIANNGTTTLVRTLVRFNLALGNATAGGGIFNAGAVTLTRSAVRADSPDDCAPANAVPGCPA